MAMYDILTTESGHHEHWYVMAEDEMDACASLGYHWRSIGILPLLTILDVHKV
jgi:hypothetical protein